jgi:CheY-like chemotaxis protein
MSQTSVRPRQWGSLVLLGTFFITASLLINAPAPPWSWDHHPFRAVLERFAAFAALTIGKAKALEQGARYFLEKPYDPKSLIKAVEPAITESATEARTTWNPGACW